MKVKLDECSGRYQLTILQELLGYLYKYENNKRISKDSKQIILRNVENDIMPNRLEEVSLHTNSKKGVLTECANYCTRSLILHARKIMVRIIQCIIGKCQHGKRDARCSNWL